MRVVVADVEKGSRTLLCRLLQRYLNVEAQEAESGLDTLALIEDVQPDLAVIDLDLSWLDGLSVIRQVRGSQAFASLPIVATSRAVPRTVVHELLGLGVHDILLKPYEIEFVEKRLVRLIHGLRPQRPARPVASALDALERGTQGILLVDGDASFRRFAAPILSASFRTHETSSGATALRLLSEEPVGTVCVGDQLDLFSGVHLGNAIRRLAGGDRLRLVRVADQDDRAAGGPFDDWLPRLWVPSEFSRQVRRVLLGDWSVADRLRAVPSLTLTSELVSAVQHTAGTMLASAARPRAVQKDRYELVASLDLTSTDASMTARVALACQRNGAQQFATLLGGGSLANVTPEDVLCEMANTVAGRLQECLAIREIPLRMGLPGLAVPAHHESSLSHAALEVAGEVLDVSLHLRECAPKSIDADASVELF